MAYGRYAQICIQFPRDVFEQINFATCAEDRRSSDSKLFSFCWTGGARGVMQEEGFATHESGAPF
jgi:hypothetical protein